MRVDLDQLTVRVPVDLGASQIRGELLSLYRCPSCKVNVRMITAFEDAETAGKVVEKIMIDKYSSGHGRQGDNLEYERVGPLVVGTAFTSTQYGPKPHGAVSTNWSYYGGERCQLDPYIGTPKQLVAQIWHRVGRGARFPSVRFDVSRLDGVEWVRDLVNERNRPLLMASRAVQRGDVDGLIGRWEPRRETYAEYAKREEKLPELFVKSIAIS